MEKKFPSLDSEYILSTSDNKLSPTVQQGFKRTKMEFGRSQKMKSLLLPWIFVLAAVCCEIFMFGSWLGSILFSSFFSIVIISWCEYVLLGYVITMITWLLYYAINPHSNRLVEIPMNSPKLPSTPSKNLSASLSLHMDTSRCSDIAWVDEHQFGISPEKRSTPSRRHRCSQSKSNVSMNDSSFRLHTSWMSDVSTDVPLSTCISPRTSPYNKQIDSIHTREQLDRLLKKDSDSTSMDLSTSLVRSSVYSYFNMLDIRCAGERRGYQLSEETKQSDGKDGYVKITSNGRVVLSPVRSEVDGQDEMTRLRHTLQHARHSPRKTGSPLLRRTDSMERRRRSASSPDRQPGSSGSAPIPEMDILNSRLEETDLQRGEHRLRAWIVNTILGPLNVKIKEVNAILEKEHVNPPLHIDCSSVDTLLAAVSDRPALFDTALPYVLPYLSCHTNQAYLVARISELAADPFMKDYKWNGGGSEWTDEKISTGRIARRPWGEHLPADSMIVFSLFCTYMDGQLTATPLVGSGKIEQPFSSVFTLKTPQKPSPRHLAAGSFYIHMSSVCPPHWEFVSTDSDGSPARAPIARGPSNLFRAILQLVHHAKVNNCGRLDHLSIGSSGINIACILD